MSHQSNYEMLQKKSDYPKKGNYKLIEVLIPRNYSFSPLLLFFWKWSLQKIGQKLLKIWEGIADGSGLLPWHNIVCMFCVYVYHVCVCVLYFVPDPTSGPKSPIIQGMKMPYNVF